MLLGNKNLKDSEKDIIKDNKNSLSLSTSSSSESFNNISYNKTQKLITVLYIVTDIMDKDEPIRNKLRTLGIEILSDITSMSRSNVLGKIQEVLSFLNIALTMNFISEMNGNIIKKEFILLNESLKASMEIKPEWLTEFFPESDSKGHVLDDNGHPLRTRLGVQKGSTLLKALSKVEGMKSLSNKSSLFSYPTSKNQNSKANFDILKKQRREDIVSIIKNSGGSATIKDIKIKINNGVHESLICSEKTLQRELVSMTKDGVLNKTGEKRWTQYSL